MWNFFDNHPTIAIIVISVFIVMAISIVVLIVKATKSGNGVEAEVGKDGFKFNAGKKEKINKEELERDILANAVFLSNSIISWKTGVSKEIDKLTQEVIIECIRHASTRIDNSVNEYQIKYGSLLKETKKELTQEDNYQIIIYGFLTEQIKEKTKDIICSAIRADNFENKTEIEIKTIGEDCYSSSKSILEKHIQHLRKDIIEEIEEECCLRVKKIADEVIELTAQKYKNLKKEIESIIEEKEEKFRAELKIKFPNLKGETVDLMVSYYNS
jgi:hypothetical protein